jgi:hypothetical protein
MKAATIHRFQQKFAAEIELAWALFQPFLELAQSKQESCDQFSAAREMSSETIGIEFILNLFDVCNPFVARKEKRSGANKF